MTGTQFNVFLGGTGEELDKNDYELSIALRKLLKTQTSTEFVDYVFYNGVDTTGDHHHYPLTPTPSPLGKEGELLLGEGSDNILNSVCALVKGEAEPHRLIGMLTDEKRHPAKQAPINLHTQDPTALTAKLAEEQHLSLQEQSMVKRLIDGMKNKKITQVNLVAWSRGAYNAIRIANRLYQDCPSVMVNILALDPVPGPLNHTPDTLILRPNVRHYASLISLSERRLGFIPILPVAEIKNATERRIHTIPGNHSTLMGDRNRAMTVEDPVAPVADRTLHFAKHLLKSWGVFEGELKEDKKIVSDWLLIDKNRALYAQPVIESSVSSNLQVINTKIVETPEGKMEYRMVQEMDLGYVYLDAVPGLQINSPHPLDKAFEIASDTCTLHRDFNDSLIVQGLETQIIKARSNATSALNFQQKLYELITYIEGRHRRREKDVVYRESIENLKKYALATLSDHPQPGQSLFLAAYLGRVEQIDLLPQAVNQQNEENDTPLIVATRYGNENFIKALNKQGVNYQIKNKLKETALLTAVKYGQIGPLTLLRNHYPEKEQFDALIYAAKHRQTRAVNALAMVLQLEKPILCNHEEIDTLLRWTVENNALQLFKDLVKNTQLLITKHQMLLPLAQALKRTEMVQHLEKNAPVVPQGQAPNAPKLPNGSPPRSFLTTPRVVTGTVALCAFTYSATVLASSVIQPAFSVAAQTLFIASQVYAPVAIIAITLAILAAGATLVLAGQGYQHHQKLRSVSP